MSNPVASLFKWALVPKIENKLPVIRGAALEPRPLPAGAKLHYQGDDGVKLSVPGYRRGLLKWGALLVLAIPFLWFPAISFLPIDREINSWGIAAYGRNWFGTVMLCLGLIGYCIWAFRFLKPRVVITARGDRIRVAGGNNEGMIFDTAYYSGMRKGFEMKSGKVKDQPDLGMFTGLRVGYGLWGEETSFMFQKGRGVEYLLWINAQIEPVITSDAVHESEVGERAQAF